MDIWYQFRGCVFTYVVSGILKCPHKTSCLILGTLELMRYYSLIMVCVKGNFANIIRITNELNVNQSQERIPSGPNVITRPSEAGLSPGGHRWQIRDIQSRRNECSITSFETRRGSVPDDRQHQKLSDPGSEAASLQTQRRQLYRISPLVSCIQS